MNTILSKQRLSAEVFRMEIEAKEIAEARKPGQFIILQMGGDFGERIPLTIADADPVKGSITLIFQAVGETTHRLALLEVGDTIENLLGPLGKPTDIKKYGKVVCVGGGIGVAPLFPIVQGMKRAGNEVKVIMGARNKDLLIMEEDMKATADEVIVVTDDTPKEFRATNEIRSTHLSRPTWSIISTCASSMIRSASNSWAKNLRTLSTFRYSGLPETSICHSRTCETNISKRVTYSTLSTAVPNSVAGMGCSW